MTITYSKKYIAYNYDIFLEKQLYVTITYFYLKKNRGINQKMDYVTIAALLVIAISGFSTDFRSEELFFSIKISTLSRKL